MAVAKNLAYACAEWHESTPEERLGMQVPAFIPPKEQVKEDVVMEDAPVTSATALSERDRSFQAAEEHIRTAFEPLCCFQCYADPEQADSRRLKHYPYHRNLVRHFRGWHLDDCRCNFCGDFLQEMHWKAHVCNVHRLLKCR